MARFYWILIGMMLTASSGATLQAATGTSSRALQPSGLADFSHERRVALVIGNSAYQETPLRNPVNDARVMAEALADLGFSVKTLENASLDQMMDAIRGFGEDIKHGGVSLFYYAGHGIQVGGKNFLIPVDAHIDNEDLISKRSIDVENDVLAKMDEARNGLNILVLDACRNNPFVGRFRSASRGLAQMEAPTGTWIAFATAPGKAASDGSGDNGLYTKHLASRMLEPGLRLEDVFIAVANDVERESAGAQSPWVNQSIKGRFYFKPAITLTDEQMAKQPQAGNSTSPQASAPAPAQASMPAPAAPAPAQPQAPAATQATASAQPPDTDQALWDSVKNSGNPRDLESYLHRYPSGQYTVLGQNRLLALTEAPTASSRGAQATAAGTTAKTSEPDKSATPASSGGATWQVRGATGQPGAKCHLETPEFPVSDGYNDSRAQVIVDGSSIVVSSKSVLDPSFSDIGLKVDDKGFIKMDRNDGDRKAVFDSQYSTIVEQFKKGRSATLQLRFWPTWPATGTHTVTVSLKGFTKAYTELGACK